MSLHHLFIFVSFFFAGTTSFEQLVQQFQAALYHTKTPLYDTQQMKTFSEKHAPGLWEIIFKAISRNDNRLSEDHANIQRQRVVVLLHILAYFR